VFCPAPVLAVLFHVVTKVIAVDPAFLAAVIITVSPVYTDKSSFN
jgi:hypothetical protein